MPRAVLLALPFPSAPYPAIHALQQRLLRERIEGLRPDTVLWGEHESVITLGRSAPHEAPASPPAYAIERGGQATWHGPGQLVGYPIVSLRARRLTIRAYLRALEDALIDALRDRGIAGRAVDGRTGVWVGDRKIASIGVAVRKFVSWHGFALNVRADLGGFQSIRPCGFPPEVMTSVDRHAAEAPTVAAMGERVLVHLAARLGGAELQTGEAPIPPADGWISPVR